MRFWITISVMVCCEHFGGILPTKVGVVLVVVSSVGFLFDLVELITKGE